MSNSNLNKVNYHDKRASKATPTFQINDTVYFKIDPNDKMWTQGIISQIGPQPRSLTIRTPDGTYRRNQIHVKKLSHPSKSDTQPIQPNENEGSDLSSHVCRNTNDIFLPMQNDADGPYVTKYGRTVKEPCRLNL